MGEAAVTDLGGAGTGELAAERAGELPGFAGLPGDQMAFAAPVIAAAGLPGGVTAGCQRPTAVRSSGEKCASALTSAMPVIRSR